MKIFELKVTEREKGRRKEVKPVMTAEISRNSSAGGLWTLGTGHPGMVPLGGCLEFMSRNHFEEL